MSFSTKPSAGSPLSWARRRAFSRALWETSKEVTLRPVPLLSRKRLSRPSPVPRSTMSPSKISGWRARISRRLAFSVMGSQEAAPLS